MWKTLSELIIPALDVLLGYGTVLAAAAAFGFNVSFVSTTSAELHELAATAGTLGGFFLAALALVMSVSHLDDVKAKMQAATGRSLLYAVLLSTMSWLGASAVFLLLWLFDLSAYSSRITGAVLILCVGFMLKAVIWVAAFIGNFVKSGASLYDK